ncbi:hypothetical protein NIES4103_00630 [Nostoc sp. NIES-4103]|nr:hypothetical protein NIES4103_00630 [Nostoc sp. NIES-4103]
MTQEKQSGNNQNFPKGEFEGYLPREDSDTPTPKQSPSLQTLLQLFAGLLILSPL